MSQGHASRSNASWPTVRLADAVDILDSKRVPINATERDKRIGDIPYYGATGQVGWIDDFIFDEELVLLGEDGAPFLDRTKPVAYLVTGKSWVNNHAHVLKMKDGHSNRFLMHQLNVVDYHDYVSGTTRLKLPQGAMKNIEIVLPPPETQRKTVDAIESYLSRLDNAVESLKAVQAKLKQYRASVLKAAVEGRLVPTEAELARKEGKDYEPASVLLERILKERKRRWIEDAAQKGRAKALEKAKKAGKPWTAADDAKALESEREKAAKKYKEPVAPDTEGLPELPEGWCWATVDQLAWSGGYGTSVKCSYDADGPPVLRIPNIQDRSVSLDDLKYATSPSALQDDLRLQHHDLVFIRTNGSRSLIGRGALVASAPDSPLYFASYLIRLRIVAVEGLSEWVTVCWHSQIMRKQILRDAASSAGQHNVSLSAAVRYCLPLPPLAEQARVVQLEEQQESTAGSTEDSLARQVRRLDRLRQAVLASAFSGALLKNGL